MFDWFFYLLFKISRSILRLIDGLMSCCNKLAGIEKIQVLDQETDFLTYILFDERIMEGFKIMAVLGILVVMFFAIIQIIRTWFKEKPEGTPAQILVSAGKTMLTFCFVPFIMLTVMTLCNELVIALYKASLGGENVTLGNFLCGAFSQDAAYSNKDYYLTAGWLNGGGYEMDCSKINSSFFKIKDFDFLFCWTAGFFILLNLMKTMMLFVDRAISIAVLFIVSPVSIGTSIIDGGSHFKLWRDQILVKFLTGYGTIIGINVYAILCNLISGSNVIFFDNSFLNSVFKIAIILGGAVSLERLMALIGNVISSGAGSNEMREAAQAFSSAASGAKTAFKIGKGIALAPLNAAKGIYNFKQNAKKYGGVGGAIGKALGFDVQKKDGSGSGGSGGDDNQNNKSPDQGEQGPVGKILGG